ncbi:MAG: hypothetical protein M3O25_00910 [Actinomycetota bacterium]|nr:hypothetical protein [Actinomycetota bacterium]
MPIEEWLDRPTAGHSYETVVPLDPERALAHALAVPVAPDPLVRTLFKLRGLDPDGSIEGFGSTPPFVVLSHTPTEWVAGVAAGVWRPGARAGPTLDGPARWAGWDEPGSVRAAMTLRAVSRPGAGDWSRLITETAAQPSDEAAARAFRVYWLFVGPFSKLIRKRWLRAMAERARAVGTR